MKVFLIVMGLPDKLSPARSLFNLVYAEELARRNNDVTIFYLRSINPSRLFSRKRTVSGIQCYEFSTFLPPYGPIKRNIFFPGFFRFLLKFRKLNADIIHVIGGQAAVAGLILSRSIKSPFIIQFIGNDIKIDIEYLSRNKLFNESLNKCSFISFESRDLEIVFDTYYKGFINKVVIYRGTKLAEFGYFFEKSSEISLLFLGGMPDNSNIKGGFTLLDAIKTLNSACLKQSIHFIIGGPDIPDLSTFINNISNTKIKISVIGAIPKDEVKVQLKKSHIVLVPSLSEGFPNVVWEAMATGNMIIASSVGGIPEIIENGITGILIEPDKPEILAESIIDVTSRTDEIEQYSLRARKKVEFYDYSLFIESYTRLFLSALSPVTSTK